MKINRNFIIIVILFIIMILSNIISIMTFIDYKNTIPKQINSIVIKEVTKNIKSISIPKDGVNGYTPIKGIDYFDGISIKGDKGDSGINGLNGKDGYTPIKDIDYFDGLDGNDGVDGKTPIIRCNTIKNRWEYKYDEDEIWQPLNNQIVKCTIKE